MASQSANGNPHGCHLTHGSPRGQALTHGYPGHKANNTWPPTWPASQHMTTHMANQSAHDNPHGQPVNTLQATWQTIQQVASWFTVLQMFVPFLKQMQALAVQSDHAGDDKHHSGDLNRPRHPATCRHTAEGLMQLLGDHVSRNCPPFVHLQVFYRHPSVLRVFHSNCTRGIGAQRQLTHEIELVGLRQAQGFTHQEYPTSTREGSLQSHTFHPSANQKRQCAVWL
jgi:hypothetical protein